VGRIFAGVRNARAIPRCKRAQLPLLLPNLIALLRRNQIVALRNVVEESGFGDRAMDIQASGIGIMYNSGDNDWLSKPSHHASSRR
jgi:hypothetical protein